MIVPSLIAAPAGVVLIPIVAAATLKILFSLGMVVAGAHAVAVIGKGA